MGDVTFDFQWWLILIGALSPFVTAIATKLGTPDWEKGLVSITVAAASAALASVGEDWDWSVLAGDFVQVWGVHLATWLGLTATAVERLHTATANVGIGSRR